MEDINKKAHDDELNKSKPEETIHVNIPEHEDFEIINSFANKMLTEATPIDEEIQNVINGHFWDML